MTRSYRQAKFTSGADRGKIPYWLWGVQLLVVGLLVTILVKGSYWFWHSIMDAKIWPVRHIRIVGQLQHLNRRELLQKVQSSGMGFFSVDMLSLKQDLIVMPWVQDIAMVRIWPDTLIVNVYEQQAIARWDEKSLLSLSGDVFKVPIPQIPAKLPHLFGPNNSQQKVFSCYREINPLFASLHLSVQQLRLDNQHEWELVLSNGWVIAIGHDEIVPRIKRLIRWFPKIVADDSAPIVHIDLRYAHGIAVERIKN